MRTCTLLVIFMCLTAGVVHAQSASGVLTKVSDAMHGKQWEQSVDLFKQAIRLDADKAEMFYWTGVDKGEEVSIRMAAELALFYKTTRNYDKAYLFYKELTQAAPRDVTYLVSCAEVEVLRGEETNALKMYEHALELDANNLAANIFIGNYYFIAAEQNKEKVETNFKKIAAPTRMQYARYKSELTHLFADNYSKARFCLENVVRQFSSAEAKRTLEKIHTVEKEINK